MILDPCPICEQKPAVTVCDTASGTVWKASCSCFDIRASGAGRLACAWASYCAEMEGRRKMLNVKGIPRNVHPEVYRSVERAAWTLAIAVDHLAAAPDSCPVVDEWVIDRMHALRHILYDLDQALEADA